MCSTATIPTIARRRPGHIRSSTAPPAAGRRGRARRPRYRRRSPPGRSSTASPAWPSTAPSATRRAPPNAPPRPCSRRCSSISASEPLARAARPRLGCEKRGSGGMATAAAARESDNLQKTRLVIGASSVGTVFEWYDFFIYGTLAASGIIGRTFFPAGNETLQTLLAWAGFAVGFGFRPLGAILFGYMGDRLGRKYTFLVTITLMGLATAGVGLVPSAASIGLAAPILIILLRIMQGLALGGEYGGAAIYVAEHAPPGKAGFYTSFIQASVVGGFVLSLAVVLGTRGMISAEAWDAWGWRIPFLFSILLLAVSLWMRLKLAESPVFKELKEAGECAANPFKESFTYPGNLKRLFVALFGIAAGLTVIWYTAMFTTLSLLQNTMRVEATTAQLIVGLGAFAGCGWYILFGRLSDRVGRKKPIVIGYALTLLLLFPIFWLMGSAANPGLAEASRRAPVTIQRASCDFDPF